MFQMMVRVCDPPFCSICEAVMKQLEAMLEDKATEVKYFFVVAIMYVVKMPSVL